LELPDGEIVDIVDGHTYNLSPMWRLAGVFTASSSELEGELAASAGTRAAIGLLRAVTDPAAFRALNPPNGWGDYDGFVEVLTRFAIACADHPTGIVRWNG
jgi:hypothetical protein